MKRVRSASILNLILSGTYRVEMPPKLDAISSVLKEVYTKLSDADRQQKCPVLILLRHARSIEVVHYYLQHGETKLRDWLVQGRSAYEHPVEEPIDNEEPSPPKRRQNPRIPEPTLPPYARRMKGAPRGKISCGLDPAELKEKKKIETAPVESIEETPSLPKETTEVTEVCSKQIEQSEEMGPSELLVEDLPPGCISVVFKPAEDKELKVILRVPPPGCGEEGAPSSGDPRSLDGPAGRLGGVLTRLRPRCIIFYEPRVAWVREVEVYAAKEARRRSAEGLSLDPVNVFFMVYKESVEEQRYLTQLRRVNFLFFHDFPIKLR